MDTITETPRISYSCTETAKLMRVALKASFPGQKFSVRSDSYAGGASIDVRWNDGPTIEAVNKIAKAFSGATFDGMQDLKEYHDSIDPNGNRCHYGADFVFTNRDISRDNLARCVAQWNAENSDKVQLNEGKYSTHVSPVDTGDWRNMQSTEHWFNKALEETKF